MAERTVRTRWDGGMRAVTQVGELRGRRRRAGDLRRDRHRSTADRSLAGLDQFLLRPRSSHSSPASGASICSAWT